MSVDSEIKRIEVSVYKIPTDFPESDGTLEWTDTTTVVVEAYAGNNRGIGYTFADAATGRLIKDKLAPLLVGRGCDGGASVLARHGEIDSQLGAPGNRRDGDFSGGRGALGFKSAAIESIAARVAR
jgi:hypothetical protein